MKSGEKIIWASLFAHSLEVQKRCYIDIRDAVAVSVNVADKGLDALKEIATAEGEDIDRMRGRVGGDTYMYDVLAIEDRDGD